MKVLVICNMGASSSVLVQAIQDDATARGLGWEVEEVGLAEKAVATGKDIVLIAPQIRYMEKEINKLAPDAHVFLINPMDYGRMNGSKVVDMVLENM